MGGKHWTDDEVKLLKPALEKMEGGASIYSQIIWLQDEGGLRDRSWDSIRRQLADGLKVRKAYNRAMIAQAGKVLPRGS